MKPEKVVEVVTNHYLSSGDFNGLPIAELREPSGKEPKGLITSLRRLVEVGSIRVLSPEDDVNPHIIGRGFPDVAKQVEGLSRYDPDHSCLYPAPSHLKLVVKPEDYAGRPFTLELAHGSAQFQYRSFDLAVLERYRNDPRYYYTADDVCGSISVRDKFYVAPDMAERDKVLLQTFGFSYNEQMDRAVAVFLRYLSGLSPEHQQVWSSQQVGPDFRLHPDYYRSAILGEWGERVSIHDAFLAEMVLINEMACVMGRRPLFRRTYKDDKPRRLSFLIRPTRREYSEYVHLLDKLLSDNIDPAFFMQDIEREEDVTRKDGRIEVRHKGTLRLLEEWIRRRYTSREPAVLDKMFDTLRKVRKKRQPIAHEVEDDVFDQEYIRRQRELVGAVYDAVRTLRMILESHPAVRASSIVVPEYLRLGKVWSM